jgi:hypothetical protein
MARRKATVEVQRDDALVRVLLASARHDAVLTRGAVRRAATRMASAGRRELTDAREGLAPVRRELRRLGDVRTGTPA